MVNSIEKLKEMLSEQMINFNIDPDDEGQPSWRTETPKGIDAQLRRFSGKQGEIFYLDRTTEPGVVNMVALYFDVVGGDYVNITRDEYKIIE